MMSVSMRWWQRRRILTDFELLNEQSFFGILISMRDLRVSGKCRKRGESKNVGMSKMRKRI